MDVYVRARPVARSEARFPPPHQEPGTGARSCPRGPGFLVAPGHGASSGVCPRRRPGPLRAEPLSEPLGVDLVRRGLRVDLGQARVPYRRPFAAAMAWSTVS